MPQLVWLNGRIMPMAEAHIAVEDRGFQFADGVYEVMRLYDGRPFALQKHLDRLARSCDGLMLSMPIDRDALVREMQMLVDQSGMREGLLYLQLTRGVSRRSALIPEDVSPTLLFYVQPLPPFSALGAPDQSPGLKLWSVPDERWRRCWIKAIGLTANILAKNLAAARGADEAAFVENEIVSECSSSNLFAVINDELITHPVGPRVLPGVTREILLECAARINLRAIERPLTLAEAKAAGELFISGTSREVAWVSYWDDAPVRPGRCGPITMKLFEAFEKYRREID